MSITPELNPKVDESSIPFKRVRGKEKSMRVFSPQREMSSSSVPPGGLGIRGDSEKEAPVRLLPY